MDDQRGQREWEVSKPWIAKSRSVAAQAALDNFARESSFVRARGAVSKTYYFETAQSTSNETVAQRSAADLALLIQGALRELCVVIPFMALLSSSDPIVLPARAILTLGNGDYVPLSIEATLNGGTPLPDWLKLEASTGLLSIMPDHRMEADLNLQIQFKFFEGTIKTFASRITLGEAPSSKKIVAPVLHQLKDTTSCKLDEGIRELVQDQLMHVTSAPLGKLIQILTRCQGILRTASVASQTGVSRKPLARGHSNGLRDAVPLTPP